MSFVAGAGVCAMVGAIFRGSLTFRGTVRVTLSRSFNLRLMIFAIKTGM